MTLGTVIALIKSLGGGGGGGGASVLVVTATDDGEGNYTLDKTASEIASAFPLVEITYTSELGTKYTAIATMNVVIGGYSFTDTDYIEYTAESGSDYPHTPGET